MIGDTGPHTAIRLAYANQIEMGVGIRFKNPHGRAHEVVRLAWDVLATTADAQQHELVVGDAELTSAGGSQRELLRVAEGNRQQHVAPMEPSLRPQHPTDAPL